jgi:hypothetical protein
MLVPRDDRAGLAAIAKERGGSWVAVGARLVRNAAIALALLATVPIGIVAVRGDNVWKWGEFGANTRARMARVEVSRPLMLPKDASITPMQAGLAFNALSSTPKINGPFEVIVPLHRPSRTWESIKITDDMFPSAHARFPNLSAEQLFAVAEKGFSSKEMTYLRAVSDAPVWKDFMTVARAPAIDLVGGRIKMPFPEGASPLDLPSASFQGPKAVANAAVARAAYYLSINQRDSAEAMLRAVVSFGFALEDNSTNLIEELNGSVIVGIGRSALGEYYRVTHDPRAGSPEVALFPKDFPSKPIDGIPYSAAEARRRLIARASDPKVGRGERFEAINRLSMSSCTNVRELLFGHAADVTSAVAQARRDLARYPSERAVIDLNADLPSLELRGVQLGPMQLMAASAGAAVGVVIRNPRLATCALVASSFP